MSIVPTDIKKTVGFIFQEQSAISEKLELHPLGTGFFVGIQQGNINFCYFVTAKHVLCERDGSIRDVVWIRLNRKTLDSSGNEFFHIRVPYRNEQGRPTWIFHEDALVDPCCSALCS